MIEELTEAIAQRVDAPAAERGRWRSPVAVGICCLVFVFLVRDLLSGAAVPVWDADRYFMPYYVLLADHVRQGQLLTWDPWSWGGVAAFSEPQIGAISPVTLLFGLLTGGHPYGSTLYWLTVWLAGGMGVFVLGRHLRTPAWGCLVGCMGYLFCSVYVDQAQHVSWVVSMSFLPWILWRTDVAAKTGSLRAHAQAGAVWGLSALSGYPGLTMATAIYAGLWYVGRVLTAGGGVAGVRRAGRGFVYGVIGVTVGLVVLSPTYVGFFYEGHGVHKRVGDLDRELIIRTGSVPPAAMVGLASPEVLVMTREGRGGQGVVVGPNNAMLGMYAGIGTLMLAVVGLVLGGERRWRGWLLGVGALFALLAMGHNTPLRGWMYDWLPPARMFRFAGLFRSAVLMTVVVFALYGSRGLANALANAMASGRRRGVVVASGVWLMTGAGFLAWLCFLGLPLTGLGWWQQGIGLALGGAVLAAGLLGRRWAAILPALFVAGGMADGWLTFQMTANDVTVMTRAPAALQRWRDLELRHQAGLSLGADGFTRLAECRLPPGPLPNMTCNDNLVTREPTLQNYTVMPSLLQPFNATLRVNATLADWMAYAVGAQRVWFSPEATGVRPELARRAWDQAVVARVKVPMIVSSAEPIPGGNGKVEAVRLPARVLLYTPTRLKLLVTAPSAGWLLVTDRWTRSWRVKVNGEVRPVYPGNVVFRAIQIPAGAVKVDFEYRIGWLYWLVGLSWGTLVGVLGWSLVRRGG